MRKEKDLRSRQNSITEQLAEHELKVQIYWPKSIKNTVSQPLFRPEALPFFLLLLLSPPLPPPKEKKMKLTAKKKQQKEIKKRNQYVQVSLVVGSPEPDTVLQMRPHQL